MKPHMKPIYLLILLFAILFTGCPEKQTEITPVAAESAESQDMENIEKTLQEDVEEESFFKTVYLTGYSFGENEYEAACIVRDEETEQQEINLFNEIELNVTDDQLRKCHENLAYSDDRLQIHTYYVSDSHAYDVLTQYDPFFIVKTKAADGSENKRIFLNKMKDHGRIKEIKKLYEAKNGTIYISIVYVYYSYDGYTIWESIYSINKNNEFSYLLDVRTESSDYESCLYYNQGFLESKNRVLLWVADNYDHAVSGNISTSIYDLTGKTIRLKHNEYAYINHISSYEGTIAYLPEGSELYNEGQLVYKAEEDTKISFSGCASYEGTDENGIWYQNVYFYLTDNTGYYETYISGLYQLNKIKFVYEVIKTETLTKDKVYWTQDNLRLRDSDNLSGNVITTLKSDITLKLIKIGKEDTIDDIKSNWAYVKVLSTGEKGWCFGGYIAETSMYK